MSIGIVNAAPMAVLPGVQDLSARELPAEIAFSPIHMAFVPLYTQRGPEGPSQVVGSARTKVYGSESFNLRGKYSTHGTILSNVLDNQANPQIVYRMRPADAPDPATSRLSLEVVEAEVPIYERDAGGAYRVDSAGNPIPTGNTVDGYILRWVEGEAVGGVGQAVSSVGELVSGNNASTRYPIYDDRVSSFGKYGNNVGRRLWAATAKTNPAVDSDVVASEGTALFRIAFVERETEDATPQITNSLSDEPYVEFSFKPGAMNRKIEADMFIDDRVLKMYRRVDSTSSATPVYGPVDRIHVYHAYVSEILKKLYAAECAYTGEEVVEDSEYLINFLDGLDVDGNPYHTILVQGALDQGAVAMTSTTTHYSQGGGDGTMTEAGYNQQVGTLMTGFETNEFDLMDMAKYPITTIWDTGFPLDIKKRLLIPMGLRKDVTVILSTQSISDPPNSRSEESSIAVALRAAALQYPESDYYGTKACRAAIIGHCGAYINDSITKVIPMTIDLASKVAAYMGSSTATMLNARAFDRYPNNVVALLKDVNITYKSTGVRNIDWANGLCWVQQLDARTVFYPGLQTVYDDDTSVLNSLITVLIVAYCEKVVVQTWKQLTGRSDLTKEQFIERSNQLIAEGVRNRFDGRVVIEPDTYYTAADDARGYSWSCRVNVYANVMKTVGTYTIVTRRMEDLIPTGL